MNGLTIVGIVALFAIAYVLVLHLADLMRGRRG